MEVRFTLGDLHSKIHIVVCVNVGRQDNTTTSSGALTENARLIRPARNISHHQEYTFIAFSLDTWLNIQYSESVAVSMCQVCENFDYETENAAAIFVHLIVFLWASVLKIRVFNYK